MVGVLLHDLLQAPTVCVLPALLVEMEKHSGTSGGAFRGFDVESSLTIADPAPSLSLRRPCAKSLQPVRHHECAVETNAELADQIRIPFGVAGELGQKILGAGAGNRTQMRDQILLIHANAGVSN